MAKEKKEATTPSAGGGSGGGRARARKNRQLKLCRRKIKKLEAKGRHARAERIKVHMGYVMRGEPPPYNAEKRQARQAFEERMKAKEKSKQMATPAAPPTTTTPNSS